MKVKHIAVVDGLWGGHHPTYVKALAKILLGAGYHVSVLCPAPADVTSGVAQYRLAEGDRLTGYQFSDREPKILDYIPKRLRSLFLPLIRWWRISRAMKVLCSVNNRPDFVFFAWLDSYLSGYLPVRLIDRMFPFLWSGLYFHPIHLRSLGEDGKPRKGWFALPESFLAKSKGASSVAVLDAGVLSLLRAELPGKPVFVLPDFTDEIVPSEHCVFVDEIKSKARGRIIIGSLGEVSRRKGILTLIRVVESKAEKNWYFVFAGELVESTFSKEEWGEVRAFFNAPRDNCYYFLKKIPNDADFNAVVNVCDVIFAMYENFPHSSNLLTKAAIFGKNVLVSCGGYMEEVVRNYDLGESVPTRDVSAALGALRRLTGSGCVGRRSVRAQQFVSEQSQEKLQRALIQLVESAMPSGNGNGHREVELVSLQRNTRQNNMTD